MVLLIAPFAPHLGEELWHLIEQKGSVFQAAWPEWDEEKLKTDRVNIVVQVNGKVRSQILIDAEADEATVRQLVLQDEKVRKWTDSREIVKVVVVKGKLVSVVVKEK
jgi:leucyl-tRNA synthetase